MVTPCSWHCRDGKRALCVLTSPSSPTMLGITGILCCDKTVFMSYKLVSASLLVQHWFAVASVGWDVALGESLRLLVCA